MNDRTLDAVLFDLDGTLIDSVHDFLAVLNHMLAIEQKQLVTEEKLRYLAPHGTDAMLEYAFHIGTSHPHFEAMREQFLSTYADLTKKPSRLFPGISTVLKSLADRQLRWGIVTNKLYRFTLPIIRALNLEREASCIVSGDTLAQCKPSPKPLFHACELLDCPPCNVVFIGDAKTDMEAGKAAGMKTIVALYGYISETERPEDWHADGMAHCPDEIIELLFQRMRFNLKVIGA